MKKVLSILLISVLFVLTGCSPKLSKYSVMLDAITAPNVVAHPSSFSIKPLNKNIKAESLAFQQESSTLFSLLLAKGYTSVQQAGTEAQIIYLDYGIEKVKEEHQTYTEPSMSMSMGFGSPFYHSYYGGGFYRPMFYNSFGYNSYRTYSKTYSYYNRYVTLLAKSAQGKELWRVDISSVGESQNMKKIIPLLIKATAPYLGTNTKEPVQLVIKEQEKKEK